MQLFLFCNTNAFWISSQRQGLCNPNPNPNINHFFPDDQTMKAYDHQLSSWLYFNQRCSSHLPHFLLSFCVQRRQRNERDQTTHTDPGLHPPPSTPSLQFPRHLCTSLRLQLHNNKALNLHGGVNPSLRKERKRWRKEVKGERERGWGMGGEWRRRGEEKRKWDAMKLNHRKGRVGQRRGTD